jgi:hypothetical protein
LKTSLLSPSVSAAALANALAASASAVPYVTRLTSSKSSIPEIEWNKLLSGPISQANYATPDDWSLYGSASFEMPKLEKTIVAKGHSTFHVVWSVTITARRKFVNPKVNLVDFVETVWE